MVNNKIFIPKIEISSSVEIRISLRFECTLAMEEQIRNQRIHMIAYNFRNKQLNLVAENQIRVFRILYTRLQPRNNN